MTTLYAAFRKGGMWNGLTYIMLLSRLELEESNPFKGVSNTQKLFYLYFHEISKFHLVLLTERTKFKFEYCRISHN
jgi:hypothetical protein